MYNVIDEVLQLVKKHGALVIINFMPDLVSYKTGNNKNRLPDPVPKGARIKKMIKHVKHVT
jgi:microsomal dipeptidase-like Zn-dependent dipeptidase